MWSWSQDHKNMHLTKRAPGVYHTLPLTMCTWKCIHFCIIRLSSACLGYVSCDIRGLLWYTVHPIGHHISRAVQTTQSSHGWLASRLAGRLAGHQKGQYWCSDCSTYILVIAHFEVLCQNKAQGGRGWEAQYSTRWSRVLYCRFKTTYFKCFIPQAQIVQCML